MIFKNTNRVLLAFQSLPSSYTECYKFYKCINEEIGRVEQFETFSGFFGS